MHDGQSISSSEPPTMRKQNWPDTLRENLEKQLLSGIPSTSIRIEQKFAISTSNPTTGPKAKNVSPKETARQARNEAEADMSIYKRKNKFVETKTE